MQTNPTRKGKCCEEEERSAKKHVITDNINNDDNDDVFCEPHQPKRKVYKRESKSKGRVFIKVVTARKVKNTTWKEHLMTLKYC